MTHEGKVVLLKSWCHKVEQYVNVSAFTQKMVPYIAERINTQESNLMYSHCYELKAS